MGEQPLLSAYFSVYYEDWIGLTDHQEVEPFRRKLFLGLYGKSVFSSALRLSMFRWLGSGASSKDPPYLYSHVEHKQTFQIILYFWRNILQFSAKITAYSTKEMVNLVLLSGKSWKKNIIIAVESSKKSIVLVRRCMTQTNLVDLALTPMFLSSSEKNMCGVYSNMCNSFRAGHEHNKCGE